MREPTRQDLLETVEDLVSQFAFEGTYRGMPALTTGGLSALENAFEVLGWKDPHPAPWRRCEYGKPRCKQWMAGIGSIGGKALSLCNVHLDIALVERRAAERGGVEGS